MKVAISYAHTSDNHKEKVLRLVKKLAENGIEAEIDYYDFDIGDDLYFFMEDLTLSPENDYVLAICNQRYKEKADNYEGGVGIETKNLRYIASKPKRNKVLPVIFEKDENGDAVRPNFLLTLGYVDLADDEDFTSDNFTELVNWLKGIRKVKPKINPVPEFQIFSRIMQEANYRITTTCPFAERKI